MFHRNINVGVVISPAFHPGRKQRPYAPPPFHSGTDIANAKLFIFEQNLRSGLKW